MVPRRTSSLLLLVEGAGRRGCWRCQFAGEWNAEKRHYYFADRRPAEFFGHNEPRTNASYAIDVTALQAAPTNQLRSDVTANTGVARAGLLYQHLSTANLLRGPEDVAIDAMHLLLLNVCKHQLRRWIEALDPPRKHWLQTRLEFVWQHHPTVMTNLPSKARIVVESPASLHAAEMLELWQHVLPVSLNGFITTTVRLLPCSAMALLPALDQELLPQPL